MIIDQCVNVCLYSNRSPFLNHFTWSITLFSSSLLIYSLLSIRLQQTLFHASSIKQIQCSFFFPLVCTLLNMKDKTSQYGVFFTVFVNTVHIEIAGKTCRSAKNIFFLVTCIRRESWACKMKVWKMFCFINDNWMGICANLKVKVIRLEEYTSKIAMKIRIEQNTIRCRNKQVWWLLNTSLDFSRDTSQELYWNVYSLVCLYVEMLELSWCWLLRGVRNYRQKNYKLF